VDNLIKEFLAESRDNLEKVDRCLVTLEAQPDDAEVVGEIFRCIHTLKGAAGFMGLGRLKKLAHGGEHLLSSLREGQVAATEAVADGLLKQVDGLRAVLTLVEETGGEGGRKSDDDKTLMDLMAALNTPEVEMTSPDRAEGAERPAPRAAPPYDGAETGSVAAMNDNALRIDVDVLNRMMNLVGELVLTRNQILQSHSETENFPQLARWDVKIVGTDLSRQVLDYAKRARYRRLEVNRGLPARPLMKYFERDGDE